mgnify:FL=1|jgi:hypothetical protein|nr:MAG TPA: hypothetical protein [Caudoviricetes sp.]
MKENWQIRLIDEKEVLGFRIDRLAKFLDKNKDVEDFNLLARQLVVMQEYYDILVKRIEKVGLLK